MAPEAGEKPYVGTQIPCNKGDRNLLCKMTKVTIRNGGKDYFLGATWDDCISPKTIASSIYEISKNKTKMYS
jgi:hypothetical protein